MVEVMLAILILSIGLFGMARLQGRVQVTEVEAYMRAQAALAIADMTERINANRSEAAAYLGTGTIGTGDSQPASCSGITDLAARDLCEWSNLLKGASESGGSVMNARGCITQIQPPVLVAGSCRAGVYQIVVTWQGLNSSAASALSCGMGQYGSDDGVRRAIATQVGIGVPGC